MNKKIKVNYKVYSTVYSIRKILKEIETKYTTISLDLETRSMYTKTQREIAKVALENNNLTIKEENEYTRIVNSNGLSHPSIINVTHIILGIDVNYSYIFICNDQIEKLLFNWIINTNLKILIHNASFDLKIIYHRTGKFPKDFEDTQLLTKTLINDCNNYHSRTGLKLLVGNYYPSKWSIKEETNYEVEDLKDKNFIEYCATDGSAVLILWDILQKEIKNEDVTTDTSSY